MNVEQQIRDEEGEILYVYKDSLGLNTIGVGVLVDHKGGGLLPEESQFIFHNRIRIAKEKLNQALPWAVSLEEPRYAVLVGMAYQMGLSGLLAFKMMIGCLQRGDYEGASKQMLNSTWATQTPYRAARMALQMKTGQWVQK